ncbi:MULTISPECIES: hypothetical protein [Nocardioides]|jgi:hypothetical protein|uniref:hypothetical protein n=1 Tax=Nocardioides TaxID=1839 RepID=UPI00032F4BE1|nr:MULTISPECIES: hypothetical protein [Nocardioides]EON23669.1 hypothetical protein CF8_2328 [Nocardioides sp. CF8]
MNTELSRLAERLGVTTGRLQPLQALAKRDVQQLDDLVSSTMTSGAEAFDKGIEEALRFVPRPLRGTARSLLFPGGDRG